MNDLAEKALHGLTVAQQQVRGHPMSAFAVAGFLASAGVVVAGARGGPPGATRALTSWFRLVDVRRGQDTNELPAVLLLVAISALVLLWLGFVEVVRRIPQAESRVWCVAAAWAAPLAVGPPLMDTSVYRNVAYGMLQRGGHNPYSTAPTRLANVDLVSALDPGARTVPSAAGPIGTFVQHLSVSVGGGSALAAVVVLRGVAVLSLAWIGHQAADMAGARPDTAVSLTSANPLALLYLVSAAHLDGLMIALALAAIGAANQRRWLASVALASLAGSVTAQGFVIVPIVIAGHVLGRRTVPAWRIAGRDLIVAAGTTGVLGLVLPYHFGWVDSVGKQFAEHTPFALSSIVARILQPVVRAASYDDLSAGGRVTAVTAAVCTIGYLTWTVRHRALERSVGYALLAVALLAPDLRPWYVLWGLLCLAATATGPRRVWVLALSTLACFLRPPGFSPLAGDLITGTALVITAAALGWLFLTHREEPDPSSLPSGATPFSDPEDGAFPTGGGIRSGER
jgi:hypothetical protein